MRTYKNNHRIPNTVILRIKANRRDAIRLATIHRQLIMAFNPSPEVKSILIRTPDLMAAWSNEPLGVAGILLSKGFISGEIMSKMLIVSYTPVEKATILIEAVRNRIDVSPAKFTELLEILSEQICAREVAEGLRSTYQSELTFLMYYKYLGMARMFWWQGFIRGGGGGRRISHNRKKKEKEKKRIKGETQVH